MTARNRILAALAALSIIPTMALAAVIGGTYYAPQYDYREFFAATDGRNFQVIVAGNPFPGMDPNAVARELLPIMQAAKPRPALTFTYDAAPERPRPWYRLVLVFDSAPNLGSYAVCNGETRTGPHRQSTVYVYAVYCRNDLALSETTAWTRANSPNDSSVNQLFRELFMVVFPDGQMYRPQNGGGGDRR